MVHVEAPILCRVPASSLSPPLAPPPPPLFPDRKAGRALTLCFFAAVAVVGVVAAPAASAVRSSGGVCALMGTLPSRALPTNYQTHQRWCQSALNSRLPTPQLLRIGKQEFGDTDQDADLLITNAQTKKSELARPLERLPIFLQQGYAAFEGTIHPPHKKTHNCLIETIIELWELGESWAIPSLRWSKTSF